MNTSDYDDELNKYKEIEKRYNAILKASPDNISITDLEGRILMVSDVGLKMLNYENESELLGKPILDCIVPENREVASNNIALMFKDQMTGPGEYKGLCKDGNTIDIEVNGEFIRDDKNNPDQIIFIVRDISKRKKIEAEVKKNDEKYKFIAENTSDGILLFNSESKITYASPSYLKQFGYSEEEELGRNGDIIFSIIHPDDRDLVFSNIYKAIELKKTDLLYVYRIKHKDGHYVWREDYAKFNYDSDGKYAGSCVVCRDITERKNFEDKLMEDRKSIESKIEELEKNNKLMVGRELKMLELKNRIIELEDIIGKKN